jgi:hypothetical protein
MAFFYEADSFVLEQREGQRLESACAEAARGI